MDQALSDVTVIDLGQVIAMPFCTMLLADMGARVIKVERPGAGDDCRAWGPPWLDGESLWFLSVNRNKESVTLDYSNDAGRKVLHDMVRKADVVIVNEHPVSYLDEVQAQLTALDLLRAFLDQRQVVTADPVGEQQTRNFDVQRPVRERQLMSGSEPSIKTLSIDLLLQAVEDFFPDVHAGSASWAPFARSVLSKALRAARLHGTSLNFSTTFPQMWKSFSA